MRRGPAGRGPIRRAGVLGRPIAHTLSPVIHNAGYAAAGLAGWTYTAHECGEDDLGRFVAGLGPDWAGLSLTMPLKHVALEVAREASDVSVTVGAANTLVRLPSGAWRAENTDAGGIVDALRAAAGPALRPDRVDVLGAGGTARAALAAAKELGASRATVFARRPEAVDELRPVASALGLTLVGAGLAPGPGQAGSPVVISTVPRGVADPLAGEISWPAGAVLLDVIYDPWPTPLAERAARAGVRVASGLDLLLAQAVRQFELYTGVAAPVAAMRDALHAAVARR